MMAETPLSDVQLREDDDVNEGNNYGTLQIRGLSEDNETNTKLQIRGLSEDNETNTKFPFQLDESVCDKEIPSESYTVTDKSESVKLRLSDDDELSSIKPISVPHLFKQTVSKIPHLSAMAVKRQGEWVRWTFMSYYCDVIRAAKSFIKLGLEANHSVAILGFNAPEWFISGMSAIYAGGILCGIYTTNSAEACRYVLEDSSANICVVENDTQLQKILSIREHLPKLKAIIVYDDTLKQNFQDVYTWDQFLLLGKDIPDSSIQNRLDGVAVNKCATFIYTSGTTGNPKGVMISHDSITWVTKSMEVMSSSFISFGEEIIVSFLPLSHIGGQMLDMFFVSLRLGGNIFFAQPDALKGTLKITLLEVRPTIFGSVPRVWEKFRDAMMALGASAPATKKKIGNWAKSVGETSTKNLMNGLKPPASYKIANKLVFKKVKTALGFDRCNWFVTFGAPLSQEVSDYFASLDIVILEGWGMSELTGVTTSSDYSKFRLGTIGRCLPGMKVSIHDVGEDGQGEIIVGGRSLCMGYNHMRDKTDELIDQNGWAHTGDVGYLDKDGYLRITGRIKELIITAGGENIAPVLIEFNVKRELPIVSQCQVIGDRQKFLSILLTLKTNIDMDTMLPTDDLANEVISWCRSIGSSANTVHDIILKKDGNILRAIQLGIDKANKSAISRAHVIQKWSIIPTDFSIPGGELTPSMKIKRPIVIKKYDKTIGAIYAC